MRGEIFMNGRIFGMSETNVFKQGSTSSLSHKKYPFTHQLKLKLFWRRDQVPRWRFQVAQE